MGRVIDVTGPIGPHGTSFSPLAVNVERQRVAALLANTKAVNEASGRLGLMCATSRRALALNAGLQRSFRHDALVASGVIPRKLTGRQMDAV